MTCRNVISPIGSPVHDCGVRPQLFWVHPPLRVESVTRLASGIHRIKEGRDSLGVVAMAMLSRITVWNLVREFGESDRLGLPEPLIDVNGLLLRLRVQLSCE